MKTIIAILMLSIVVNAALDQSYLQTIAGDGSSTIVKTQEMNVFSNQLKSGALERMANVCQQGFAVPCSVDQENKKITLTEKLSSNSGYYTLSSDYGFPYITYTLTITKIPTDRFSADLDKLLVASDAISSAGGGSAQPINLNEDNNESVYYLRKFKANITYAIKMPAATYEASAGNVSGKRDGSSVTFDLVEVMSTSKPVIVKSSELNWTYLIIIVAAISLGGLAITFFTTKPRKRK